MHKQLYGPTIAPTRRFQKAFVTSRLSVICLTVILTCGTTKNSHADNSSSGNRDKIAEIAALARHNERCPAAPREWAVAYLILLTMAPPSEEQVLAKEREMLALSGNFGNKKWCQLYLAEMEQAYIIYRLAIQR